MTMPEGEGVMMPPITAEALLGRASSLRAKAAPRGLIPPGSVT